MPGSESLLEVYHEQLPPGVVGSERLARPLLILHTVEHLFGVACARQGGPRVDNGHNVADGISALRFGIACARADAVGTVERDGLFRHVCVCVDLPLCAAVSQGMGGVSEASSNSC